MKVVGLMSGTSMDGIDAALVEIGERGTARAGADASGVRLLSFRCDPYPRTLRSRLLALAGGEPRSVAELCHLNVYLGELLARSVIRLLDEAGVRPEEIMLVGSHGQTVHHLPKPRREGGFAIRSTLQIGEPSVIAERTGITTVADFRHRDMAAGGEGAPLTPFAHDRLFRHPKISRGILNIGGIGNLTYLAPGEVGKDLLAFDTGPGNLLIDGLVRHLSSGRRQMDRGGRLAARGMIHAGLLSRWMAHPFFRRPPPKSTGREEFGLPFLKKALADARRVRLSDSDLAATLTALTAQAVIQSVRRFILPLGPMEELIVGGGGRFNPVLLERLAQGLGPVRIRTFEDLGCPSRAFEAMAFALLACESYCGRASNVPSVTGARRPVVLGKIVPGGYRDENKTRLCQ
jgi:anhydro-N-acetylmuramic acid kinase